MEIEFQHKRNPNLKFTVTKEGSRITDIDKPAGIRFPFRIGQMYNRTIEVWACNNGWLIDGKDTCPEKKIFGIRTKDIPQGHPFRHIYPNKFR